jgi:hypothetical protein
MDNREAKFILSAYRPGGQDVTDPRFSEALEQAERDPILRRWFEESIEFDAAMTERLGKITPPGDLRESILAGAKVSRMPQWKNRFGKLAIAAALILSASLGVVIWQNTRPQHLTGWQTQALNVVSSLEKNESKFDAQSRNSSDLVNWLRANHAPAAEKVPDNLAKLTSLGCKTFSWNGTPVSVICFMRPDGGLIHLVATNVTPATQPKAKMKPTVVKEGEWTTATWREGDQIFMLALEGSPEQLRPFLS